MQHNAIAGAEGSSPHVVRGFLAYPSKKPNLGEALLAAANQLNNSLPVDLQGWEQNRVGGKVVIREICRAIDAAELFCADLTGLNPNVLFEFGYAIAKNKRAWLVLDPTLSEFRKDFDQLKLLTTIGYAECTNSIQIATKFYGDMPHTDLEQTIFRQAIEPLLAPTSGHDILLYLKSKHDTEASNRLTGEVQRSAIRTIVDDPRESSAQTLSWYGEKVYSSVGVVCHLMSPAREGATLLNARYALVSGLAYGFEKPLLMLAEGDYFAPLDYREILQNYEATPQALQIVRGWLAPLEAQRRAAPTARVAPVELATELKSLRNGIGEYVAEQEEERLGEYFVSTTAYEEAFRGRHMIFVGRKGTGKTANLLRLVSSLGQNSDDLVCKVMPVGYEIESLVRLFAGYRERDTKGYAIEVLWKFLLYTEMANVAAEQISGRPLWIEPSEAEKDLLRFVKQEASLVQGDFSIRLERCVEALLKISEQRGVEAPRKGISEALHEGTLKRLRVLLGNTLEKKQRVAILVDNLDKAWTKQADVAHLSDFLLGLLTVGEQLRNDFRRNDSRRKPVNVTLAIFLRSDIFSQVAAVAREPDKLVYSKLVWDDPELLRRVVEERFSASHGGLGNGPYMWEHYFCPTVRGRATKDYVAQVILPRPRDMVYFIKSAVSFAVNRAHAQVFETDILDAEREYSLYAMESILVENGVTVPELEAALVEFAGARAVVSEGDALGFIAGAGIEESRRPQVIEHLIKLTFLAFEVEDGKFEFSDDLKEFRRNLVLSQRLSQQRQSAPRFKINPAFYSYLGISGDEERTTPG